MCGTTTTGECAWAGSAEDTVPESLGEARWPRVPTTDRHTFFDSSTGTPAGSPVSKAVVTVRSRPSRRAVASSSTAWAPSRIAWSSRVAYPPSMLAAANVGKAYAQTTCSRHPVRSANAAAHSSAPRLAAEPSTPTNTTSSRVMTFSPPLFGLCFTLLSYIPGPMCTTSEGKRHSLPRVDCSSAPRVTAGPRRGGPGNEGRRAKTEKAGFFVTHSRSPGCSGSATESLPRRASARVRAAM